MYATGHARHAVGVNSSVLTPRSGRSHLKPDGVVGKEQGKEPSCRTHDVATRLSAVGDLTFLVVHYDTPLSG